MTRPSPFQVLDADMPKWAAGGWKPGDAAGVLAALEEAGYAVVERKAVNRAPLYEELQKASKRLKLALIGCRNAAEAAVKASGSASAAFSARSMNLDALDELDEAETDLDEALAKLQEAERSEAAEEVERG